MKKRLFVVALLSLFALTLHVNALDTSLKIYDYAQVISSEQESELKSKVDSFIETYNMDMVLVTVKHHEKSNTRTYAEDFYDYNEFGLGNTRDGILFVIDFTFGYRDIQLLTTGEAIRMYDDSRLDKMYDHISDVSNKDYYVWFDTFITDASNYAKQGIPTSNKNTYIDENGDYIVISEKTINYPIIIIVSLVVPSVIVLIFILKNRMVKKALNADYYLLNDKTSITIRSDNFLTTHTTSVRIPRDTGSGHGGSSVSRGSSGIMHGGGSGRRL